MRQSTIHQLHCYNEKKKSKSPFHNRDRSIQKSFCFDIFRALFEILNKTTELPYDAAMTQSQNSILSLLPGHNIGKILQYKAEKNIH
jgi:hypothetical protein